MEQPIVKNVCDTCGRGFNRIEKLNMHKKRAHEAKGGNKIVLPDEASNSLSDSDLDVCTTLKKIKVEINEEFLRDVNEVQLNCKSANHVDNDDKDMIVTSEMKIKSEHSVKDGHSTKLHQAIDLSMESASVQLEADAIKLESAMFVEDRKDFVNKCGVNYDGDAKDLHMSSAKCCASEGLRTDNVALLKEQVIDDGGSSTTNCDSSKLDKPGLSVVVKEKTDTVQSDRTCSRDKTLYANCIEPKSKEPAWLIALKGKTEKEQKSTIDDKREHGEELTANHSKGSAIEPACLIEVSDVALSIPVTEPVPPSIPEPEPRPKPLLPVPLTEGITYRRDARLRKIIRPVKKLSYNEAYSDDLDDSDEKGVGGGNTAGSSKPAKVKSSRSKTRNHTPVHKDIKCPMCPEVFHDLRGVKSHILVHLNDDTQICEVCQEEITDRQNLILHLRGHVQVTYKCERCPSQFNKIGSFYHHRDKHLVEEDGFVYTCNVCGKTLYNKWYLKEHKRKHNKKTTYICEVCGKLFSTKATLKAHLEAHTSVKHTCDLCGKNYARRVGLLNHLRRDHEGIKKHECPDCGKKFFARKTLVQHTRIHTGEKPYACEFCGKTFTQKINRDQHRRLHTGEQPYRCEYCFKCFSLRAAYTQHLRTHTGFKVSEMNPSILQPQQQNLSIENNNDDVGLENLSA